LIEAAKMILSDGVRRLTERQGLFRTNQTKGREARAEIISARNTLTDYLCATYGALRHEVAACCLVDAQGRLISVEDFPQGKATHCEVDPRILASMICKSGACAVILVHNHPSGDNTPSPADVRLTEALKNWLGFMGVELIDHLVISTAGASSIIGEF
jgi:DNA repair protein RadC